MSISDEIRARVAEGRLFPVKPKSRGRRVIRYMFISEELHSAISSPAEGDFERFDELHADLVSFVVDRFVTPDYLWLLSPPDDGVWEVRSRRVEPQIRVFGQFAEKDVFVGLTYNYRSDIGAYEDPNWNYEIRKAKSSWRILFPGYSAKTTTNTAQLLTGALNERYFR
jgi:hypothetical protein